jgi:hypothetical protein
MRKANAVGLSRRCELVANTKGDGMGKLRVHKRKDKKGSGCKMCKPWKGKWAKRNKPKKQAILEQEEKEVKRCDNVDHKKNGHLFRVVLTESFNGDICYWCRDCIVRDRNMVDLITAIGGVE